MNAEFTVVIPLYNKEREIVRTLRSALEQTLPPREIIVVDDGSTDRSATLVEELHAPLVRLIRQENRGVSAARNRAIAEARTEWVALLDGDDRWEPDFLREIARLIDRYPGYGTYATSFVVDTAGSLTPGNTPRTEGPVDFFAESLRRYVLIPSATVLRRELVLALGGFPEGMRMGEDQYLWTRAGRAAAVCISPARLAVYSRSAANRSAAIYRPEQCAVSLEELYDPAASDASNEYVARVALGKALVVSSRGGTQEAARTIAAFRNTRRNRFALLKVRLLNALPVSWRLPLLGAYNRLAWLLAKRGL